MRNPQKMPLLFLLLVPFASSFLPFSAPIFSDHEQEISRSQFPDKFLFGTSTSAYQIEGGYLEDGKGLSNWDVFSHTPGKIANNQTGDVADDHYHLFLDDIDLMHSLGVNSYRFSISWARILPRGIFGKVNRKAVDFYSKIIDYLLLKGIEPFVTINHFEFPYEMEKRYGSWMNAQMQKDFVHFAKVCFEEFGDRVKYWITVNEPNLFTLMAYIRGDFPPSHCSLPFGNCSAGNSDTEPLVVMHNLLLAHARAVNVYRTQFRPRQGGLIGITLNAFMFEPFGDKDSDRDAVDRAFDFNVGWVLDPLVYGNYPEEMGKYLGGNIPSFSSTERRLIAGSLDFIGVNHYGSLYAKDCLYSSCTRGGDHPISGFVLTTGFRDGIPIGEPTGMERFFMVPEGMEKIINYMKKRYNNMPMFVTENGYSPMMAREGDTVQDIINDSKRVEFHKSYLASLLRAVRNGANVKGYFIWSLMDNFEWAHGYDMRFGIFYVDRKTLERTPKLSAKWYATFLKGINNTASSYHKQPVFTGPFSSLNVSSSPPITAII